MFEFEEGPSTRHQSKPQLNLEVLKEALFNSRSKATQRKSTKKLKKEYLLPLAEINEKLDQWTEEIKALLKNTTTDLENNVDRGLLSPRNNNEAFPSCSKTHSESDLDAAETLYSLSHSESGACLIDLDELNSSHDDDEMSKQNISIGDNNHISKEDVSEEFFLHCITEEDAIRTASAIVTHYEVEILNTKKKQIVSPPSSPSRNTRSISANIYASSSYTEGQTKRENLQKNHPTFWKSNIGQIDNVDSGRSVPIKNNGNILASNIYCPNSGNSVAVARKSLSHPLPPVSSILSPSFGYADKMKGSENRIEETRNDNIDKTLSPTEAAKAVEPLSPSADFIIDTPRIYGTSVRRIDNALAGNVQNVPFSPQNDDEYVLVKDSGENTGGKKEVNMANPTFSITRRSPVKSQPLKKRLLEQHELSIQFSKQVEEKEQQSSASTSLSYNSNSDGMNKRKSRNSAKKANDLISCIYAVDLIDAEESNKDVFLISNKDKNTSQTELKTESKFPSPPTSKKNPLLRTPNKMIDISPLTRKPILPERDPEIYEPLSEPPTPASTTSFVSNSSSSPHPEYMDEPRPTSSSQRSRFSSKSPRSNDIDTEKKVLVCYQCDEDIYLWENVPVFSRLISHLRRHGPKAWRCSVCLEEFVRKDSTVRHIHQKHAYKGQGWKDPEKLFSDLELEEEAKAVAEICFGEQTIEVGGETMFAWEYIKNYKTKLSSEKALTAICNVCKNKVELKNPPVAAARLKRHAMGHMTKPWVCGLKSCGKTFQRVDNAKYHMKTCHPTTKLGPQLMIAKDEYEKELEKTMKKCFQDNNPSQKAPLITLSQRKTRRMGKESEVSLHLSPGHSSFSTTPTSTPAPSDEVHIVEISEQ